MKLTQRQEFRSGTRPFIFHIVLIPLESYESNYFPSSYGEIEGQTELFSLGMATSLGEEKH